MTTYRANRQVMPILSLILLLWLFFDYNAPQKAPGTFWPAALVVTISVIAFLLLAVVFSKATITGRSLKFTYLLFYRRTIDIGTITEITNKPTYIAARSQFRSLYIMYNDLDGSPQHIELRITIFPESELSRLIHDLKQINPDIHLDSYSSRLSQRL